MPPRRASSTFGMRARRAAPNRCWSHTIAIAARAGRPWLSYQCPACTMISEADVRSFERHPHASIQILIPALSCPLPRRALCEAHRPSGVTGSFGAAALADTWTACRASSRQRLASAR